MTDTRFEQLVSAARLREAMRARGCTAGALLAHLAAQGVNAFTPISVACHAGEDASFAADVLEAVAADLGVPVAQLAPAREPEPGATKALAARRVGRRDRRPGRDASAA